MNFETKRSKEITRNNNSEQGTIQNKRREKQKKQNWQTQRSKENREKKNRQNQCRRLACVWVLRFKDLWWRARDTWTNKKRPSSEMNDVGDDDNDTDDGETTKAKKKKKRTERWTLRAHTNPNVAMPIIWQVRFTRFSYFSSVDFLHALRVVSSSFLSL